MQPTLQERQDTGEAGSSSAVAVAVGGELVDWTMAQEPDEGQTEANRKSVALGKEYERIQREKAELVQRMQELTLREWTLEAQVTAVSGVVCGVGESPASWESDISGTRSKRRHDGAFGGRKMRMRIETEEKYLHATRAKLSSGL